jgi:hypothetical protein
MNDIISQLTHDNDLFEEQWSDTFNHLENTSISDDSKLVLHALVDYILAEPIDPLPCDVKYLFVTMIIEQMIDREISADLINEFIRVLNSSRTDQWNLHFLETIYQKFQIGKQLSSHPMKIYFIEKILQTLQTKTFKDDDEKWKDFLFSDSTDDQNRLNQLDMQKNFPAFCNYAIQQSSQSAIWLHIVTVLNCEIPNEELLAQMENFILENRYDDACRVLSTSIDVEDLLRTIIRLCPMVEQKDLFCSDFLVSFIEKFEDLPVEKTLACIFFDLILAILKLCVPDAPNLSFRLLKKKDFYSWNDLTDGLVDLIQTCISYDRLIDEEYFSKLNYLEEIIDFISIYSKISELVQSSILEAIVRWSDNQFHGGNHVYRMGKSLLNLINSQPITEDICLKFIEILQTRIDCHNEEINQKKRFLFCVNLQIHSTMILLLCCFIL